MKYNCIIVDDEPPAIKVLEKYIESVPQLTIIGTCKNSFEALSVLNNDRIDLVFLDINMPKLIGTEMMKTLQTPPKVIFTTAHKDYAIDAFDLDAVDYLLKPVSFERFLKSVNKFCNIHKDSPTNPGDRFGFVYFRSDRKMVKVFHDDILYIESFKDYIIIHKTSNETLRVKQSLNNADSVLPSNLFIRIHRSYLVSIMKITAYTKTDVEIGKIEIPIGKSYIEAFIKMVQSFGHLPNGVEERE